MSKLSEIQGRRRRRSIPHKLSRHQTAAMFTRDPDSVEVRLSDVLEVFDLTLRDLLPDLASGRLVARMEPKPGAHLTDAEAIRRAIDRDQLWFTGQALLDWLATRQ
jgi:hypothetical protein